MPTTESLRLQCNSGCNAGLNQTTIEFHKISIPIWECKLCKGWVISTLMRTVLAKSDLEYEDLELYISDGLLAKQEVTL